MSVASLLHNSSSEKDDVRMASARKLSLWMSQVLGMNSKDLPQALSQRLDDFVKPAAILGFRTCFVWCCF